ncbi:MAG: TetR/AcrR family transcriptional regulator [Clostridia bacterium]|nr:TetR/AcrR family transcriptional regulator [Clostridia bacterium]
MARKEDLRFIRTNRKLYETFFELISDDLIENLSITDICDAAQINRATFYKHFNDRKDFVFYCIGQKVREMRLERTGRENANAATILEDCVREVYAFLRFMTEVNADNLKPDTDAIHLIYDGLMAFYLAEFSAYYAKSKRIVSVEREVFAAYRVGSLLTIAFFALMRGENNISENACEEIIATFVTKMKELE